MNQNRLGLIANHLKPLQKIEKVMLNKPSSEYDSVMLATKVNPTSNLIYCSCNLGINGNSNLYKGTFLEQFRESIRHVEKVLIASNSGIEFVIKIQIYVRNPHDAELIENELSKIFKNSARPRRVFLFVKDLPGGAKLAIDVLASQELFSNSFKD